MIMAKSSKDLHSPALNKFKSETVAYTVARPYTLFIRLLCGYITQLKHRMAKRLAKSILSTMKRAFCNFLFMA